MSKEEAKKYKNRMASTDTRDLAAPDPAELEGDLAAEIPGDPDDLPADPAADAAPPAAPAAPGPGACPKCGTPSRIMSELMRNNRIQRQRRCPKCGHKWLTVE